MFAHGRLGLVIVHAANHPFADWPEFNRMMGLGWRDDPKAGAALKVGHDGTVRRVPAGKGAGATWDPKRPVTITVRDREHPITRGMPARWRHASDEVYHTLRGPAEGLHILASYQSDQAGGDSGEHEPAAWTVDYGRGRIFVTALGHDADGQRCPGFATLLSRGTEWAATGSCHCRCCPRISRPNRPLPDGTNDRGVPREAAGPSCSGGGLMIESAFPAAGGLRTFMNPIDLAVIVVYVAGCTALGAWLGSRSQGLKGYFLGESNIPTWAVMISIVATETSIVTFLSVPGVAYQGDFRSFNWPWGISSAGSSWPRCSCRPIFAGRSTPPIKS